MRLCTHCIWCTNRLPLPKRALFPAEPPPNRPQISDRTAVLPGTIRANGQEENTGKRTSQKHPNSFPSNAKGWAEVTKNRIKIWACPLLGSWFRRAASKVRKSQQCDNREGTTDDHEIQNLFEPLGSAAMATDSGSGHLPVLSGDRTHLTLT